MTDLTISNGELGSDVRTKLNTVLAQFDPDIGGIVLAADSIGLTAVVADGSVLLSPDGAGTVQIPIASVDDHIDDAAAAVGGVPVGGLYRTASVLKIRVA